MTTRHRDIGRFRLWVGQSTDGARASIGNNATGQIVLEMAAAEDTEPRMLHAKPAECIITLSVGGEQVTLPAEVLRAALVGLEAACLRRRGELNLNAYTLCRLTEEALALHRQSVAELNDWIKARAPRASRGSGGLVSEVER